MMHTNQENAVAIISPDKKTLLLRVSEIVIIPTYYMNTFLLKVSKVAMIPTQLL